MNPRNRKLRLRKTTLRDLTPSDAGYVFGGVELDKKGDSEGGMLCGWTLWCTAGCTDGCPKPVTRAFTGCPDCPPPDPGTYQHPCTALQPCVTTE